MHGNSHAIIRLPVHLAQQQMYFREGEEAAAAERASCRKSMLTAFLK